MFRGFFKRTARFFVVVAPPKKKEKRWGADVNQSEPRTRLFLGAERTRSAWEALQPGGKRLGEINRASKLVCEREPNQKRVARKENKK
jgi:hypothetical protein